jgi:hypothetical protein
MPPASRLAVAMQGENLYGKRLVLAINPIDLTPT